MHSLARNPFPSSKASTMGLSPAPPASLAYVHIREGSCDHTESHLDPSHLPVVRSVNEQPQSHLQPYPPD